MLQAAEIRANKSLYVERLLKRGITNIEALLDEVISLDDQRKEIQGNLDSILAESNAAAKQIGILMKQGQSSEAEGFKTKAGKMRAEGKELSNTLAEIEETLLGKLYNIPNVPHESVPAGKSEDDNEMIYQVNELPVLPDSAKPHWELIKEYDIIDFELGNKVSGAGFPIYKNQGARIVRSMVNFFLDEAAKAGFQEVQVPLLVNEDSGFGTGQLPDKEGQMYHATEDNLYLIPTAEVPITNMYRGVILEQSSLPIKHAGYTPCFRREAGSWGSHVRGLNRLHQFDKVEIVQVQEPDKSYDALDSMVKHVEELIKKLGLPYRILRLCGGDLGFTSALTFDFEVYSAAQKRWLEVSSVSNFETFQANRLKLRYKDKNNKKQLLHTLNGSALAIPRILAAILENNQTPDGISIPEVLVPYTGFEKIIK